MRFFLALVVVILSFQLRLAVREQDSLFTTEKSGSFREHAGFMMHPGFENRPVIFLGYNGFDFHGLLINSFFVQNKGKIHWESSMVTGLAAGSSGWRSYEGYYGTGSYKSTGKVFIGSAGFSDRNFIGNSSNTGFFPQTNYSSSMFIGYKFSDKFSISAGFTIQGYDDLMNKNQRLGNSAIFP